MNVTLVFLNSVFPCLSETFVFDQFEALRQADLRFAIVSNHRPAATQVHPRMREIQKDVQYLCAARPAQVLAAHFAALCRHPWRYLAVLLRAPFCAERLGTTLAQISGAALLLHRFAAYPRLHLHVHFTYGAASVALWAKRLGGASYSLTVHGADLTFDHPPDLADKLLGAQAIVSISRFNLAYLRAHFPALRPDALVHIPLGIPPLREALPRRPRQGALQLLNVGRLSEHKAQHLLIEACALLRARGVDFDCAIVGEGERRTALTAQIAALGLEEKVHLLGARFHEDVLALYAQADLFVLCSVTEGQPVVLMEAMRAGLPLIAPAIAGIPELVQEAGLLVPAQDAAALAEAICRFAAGDCDARAMTARAQAIVAEEYALGKNSARFKAFLEALV